MKAMETAVTKAVPKLNRRTIHPPTCSHALLKRYANVSLPTYGPANEESSVRGFLCQGTASALVTSLPTSSQSKAPRAM